MSGAPFSGAAGADSAPQEILPGIYRLPISMPGPLQAVNAYLLQEEEGWTLVDTGYNLPESREAWRQGLSRLGLTPRDVTGIVVTHAHPDHFGGAGWLQEWTGAPVYMHDREAEVARRLWRRESGEDFLEMMAAEGVPGSTVAATGEFQLAQYERTLPHPEVTPVHEGERLHLGARDWEIIWAPGHTDGLMVLWDAAGGVLLANDMVLPKITPNIQWIPGFHPNPLALFLESLGKVGRLPARITLPGHRQPIPDLAGRTREIREHHARRLELVRRLVAEAGRRNGRSGATAWEVAQGLFGELTDMHNIRFGLAETLSHLHYLKAQGRLVREPGSSRNGRVACWRLAE